VSTTIIFSIEASMTSQPKRLLADIGGTNARFALASCTEIVASETYQVRQYPRLTDALGVFMREHCADVTFALAALAVAGPVLGDVVALTNSDWVCDKTAISQLLHIPRNAVVIINDFEAVAWALTGLEGKDITTLQAGQKSLLHPMLVMGPGTGLGVAALIPHEDGWKAVATEAGHTRYAPANNDERKLIDQIARQHIFVTAEHLISGPGLVNIYRALGDEQDMLPCEPADVVKQARSGEPRAHEALGAFAAIFGSYASQTALTYTALGGVYLTGGVLQKIAADFADDRFLQRFTTNPNMSRLLQRMPIHRVETDIPAFLGLQGLLTQKARREA
jgi:glucokinase